MRLELGVDGAFPVVAMVWRRLTLTFTLRGVFDFRGDAVGFDADLVGVSGFVAMRN